MDNYNEDLKDQARQELKQAIEKYASLIPCDDCELTKEDANYHLQYEVQDYLFNNFK